MSFSKTSKSQNVFFLFNSIGYNCFKVFFDNFIHYIDLKISRYVYQYI
jgi:hypothetical protein